MKNSTQGAEDWLLPGWHRPAVRPGLSTEGAYSARLGFDHRRISFCAFIIPKSCDRNMTEILTFL